VSIFHRWFHSGSYTLASHIHIPENKGNTAVLVVPPFGWEDICSYRSLRILSESLSANGIPSMRYDLPGTGDSSGGSQDPALVDAWIKSVGDAAAELRAVTGMQNIAVIGIRLGAMLAIAAAHAEAELNNLILWGPAATGRALLRELRAFQQMEQSSSGEPAQIDSSVRSGLEVAGFFLSTETERDLEALDISRFPVGSPCRVLILTRDSFPADRKLILALENSGCPVEVATGEGYAGMMLEPHDSVPPLTTIAAIVDFLTRNPRHDGKKQISETGGSPVSNKDSFFSSTTSIKTGNDKVIETMLSIGNSHCPGFGIVSEPAKGLDRADLCLLFFNPGAVRHIGPNRMWVEIARKWAVRGIPSLRMDFQGIGEAHGKSASEVGGLYQGTVIDQISAAIDLVHSRTGIKQFAVVGLCSGAFWGFHALVNFAEIRAGILLNPRLFFWDPNIDRRRILRRTVNGFTSSKTWSRLARGKITTKRIKQGVRAIFHKFPTSGDEQLQISPDEMSSALAAIQQNKSGLTLIFTEGEPLLQEMEEEFWLPSKAAFLRCVRVPGGGHTFRPLWAQSLIHELVDREIGSLLHPSGKKHSLHNSKVKASSLI
jgi:pimeloyl-ACP methyl ester carboxylesterase